MKLSRREFARIGCRVIIGATAGSAIIESIVTNSVASEDPPKGEYDWKEHLWGYVIDTRKCIGCGRCANACKLENEVPFDEPVYRTWVERYRELKDKDVKIDSPNGGINGFIDDVPAEEINKAFYVPKICNHCENPP
ncbi:MAG: 4Fe-4S binding protein, partial [Candidatus Methanoperedens sp.]|nr:4Fe-4S binding protein [Candidatus Methanoperedens sp.]